MGETKNIELEPDSIDSIQIIGDLRITKRSGGNKAHKGFWHRLNCYCVHSESETILCNPPYTTDKNYWECGHWQETVREKVKPQ